MRNLKLILPAAILAAGVLVSTTASYGKPEYAKKEGKSCTVCHSKVGAADAMKKEPNLTDVGKCYKDNKYSLATCKVPDKK